MGGGGGGNVHQMFVRSLASWLMAVRSVRDRVTIDQDINQPVHVAETQAGRAPGPAKPSAGFKPIDPADGHQHEANKTAGARGLSSVLSGAGRRWAGNLRGRRRFDPPHRLPVHSLPHLWLVNTVV